MKSLKTVLLTMFLFSNVALATEQDIEDIIDLATQVRLAARTSVASTESLNDVKVRLQEALDLLNGGGGGQTQGCFKFAYEKYYSTQSSEAATNNAIAACKKIGDLTVAQFLYEKYYSVSSAASAMDQAASFSGKTMAGKLDMLKFAYEKYYSTMSAVAAANRGASQISLVRRGQLGCLKDLYDKYYQTMSAAAAMDASVKACQ